MTLVSQVRVLTITKIIELLSMQFKTNDECGTQVCIYLAEKKCYLRLLTSVPGSIGSVFVFHFTLHYSENYGTALWMLKYLKNFWFLVCNVGTLDEHMHLLLPALIRLFKVDASVDIRAAAIKTLTRLIPRVQVGYIWLYTCCYFVYCITKFFVDYFINNVLFSIIRLPVTYLLLCITWSWF